MWSRKYGIQMGHKRRRLVWRGKSLKKRAFTIHVSPVGRRNQNNSPESTSELRWSQQIITHRSRLLSEFVLKSLHPAVVFQMKLPNIPLWSFCFDFGKKFSRRSLLWKRTIAQNRKTKTTDGLSAVDGLRSVWTVVIPPRQRNLQMLPQEYFN